MTGVSGGLAAWANRPGPAAVLEEVRRRARRGFATEKGVVRLELGPQQRREVGRLLGTSWELSGRQVRLQELAAALADHGLTVRSLVESLDGTPIVADKVTRTAHSITQKDEVSAAVNLLVHAGADAPNIASWLQDSGLPRPGESGAARWAVAAPGEPLWLTLRSLAEAWSVSTCRQVFICENVTVVEAAADEFGPGCPPMACTDGVATQAALNLVQGLALAGCAVTVRADVDAAGFVIVEQVRGVAPDATPWRHDRATYLEHVADDRSRRDADNPGRLRGIRAPTARRTADRPFVGRPRRRSRHPGDPYEYCDDVTPVEAETAHHAHHASRP